MNDIHELPLVSVIIPTYKRSDSLDQAIQSVLTQSYPNVEVIVVDDNNPDSEWRIVTEKRLENYKSNPRVHYIKHKCNKNGSAARNTGWRFSKAEFFCFLDDDDYFYKDKILIQVEFMNNNRDVDLCWCDYKKNGEIVFTDSNIDIVRNIFLGDNTPQTSGWLLNRKCIEKIEGFDESYYRHQDYEFLLRLIKSGAKIKKIDSVLYERTVTDVDNNPSGRKMEQIKEKLFFDFSDLIDQCDKKYSGFRRELKVVTYISISKCYLKNEDKIEGLKLILKAFLADPVLTIKEIVSVVRVHTCYREENDENTSK